MRSSSRFSRMTRAAPPWKVWILSGSVLAMMMPSLFIRLIFCGRTVLISWTIALACCTRSSISYMLLSRMDKKVRKRRWGRQPAYPLDCTAGFPVHASDEEEAALERQNVFLHRIYIATTKPLWGTGTMILFRNEESKGRGFVRQGIRACLAHNFCSLAHR